MDTSFGSVPDIYLSLGRTSNSRRQTSTTKTIPIEITKQTSSRPNSFINRPSTLFTSLNNNNHRPITSSINNSSFLHDQSHYNSMIIKPTFETIREPFLSTRLNALRTGKYVPPFFNRYYLP